MGCLLTHHLLRHQDLYCGEGLTTGGSIRPKPGTFPLGKGKRPSRVAEYKPLKVYTSTQTLLAGSSTYISFLSNWEMPREKSGLAFKPLSFTDVCEKEVISEHFSVAATTEDPLGTIYLFHR